VWSEIAVFAECPSIWPPSELIRTAGLQWPTTVNTRWSFSGSSVAFFSWSIARKAARIHYVLVAPALAAGWMLAAELARLYPFFDEEPSLRALARGAGLPCWH